MADQQPSSLEEKKSQLFALYTTIGTLDKQIAHLQRDPNADPSELDRLIDTRTYLRADASRIDYEVHNDTQAANMGPTYRLVEMATTQLAELLTGQQGIQTTLTEVSARLGKNEQDIGDVTDRVDTLEERADQQFAREQARDERIMRVEEDIQAVKTRLTDVETKQEALQNEHRQLVSRLKRDAHLLKLINEESGGDE